VMSARFSGRFGRRFAVIYSISFYFFSDYSTVAPLPSSENFLIAILI
jgi:hypothetical protein